MHTVGWWAHQTPWLFVRSRRDGGISLAVGSVRRVVSEQRVWQTGASREHPENRGSSWWPKFWLALQDQPWRNAGCSRTVWKTASEMVEGYVGKLSLLKSSLLNPLDAVRAQEQKHLREAQSVWDRFLWINYWDYYFYDLYPTPI